MIEPLKETLEAKEKRNPSPESRQVEEDARRIVFDRDD